ncbi:hypothetical protein Tco_1171154 [Tanacetum coccineum]
MNHQTSTVPKVTPQFAYQSPQAPTQLMTELPFIDSDFAVPMFSPGDDLIACLNKAMAFLTAVASSRVTVQQVQGKQGQNYSGHMARQCTQPKRPRNAAWYKEKAMLAEAQEDGQILDEEQLAFLADPGILACQAQIIIPHNAAFPTEDLNTYDSDCDDLSTAQAVLMANISNYDSDVISEVVQIVLWYLNSGCLKHMTWNRSQLMNFLGNVVISRVYYVEGLGHNLFSVGQFWDADLEVSFWKNTYFIRNLEGIDLLSGSRVTNLYTISLDDMLKSSPICLLSKASKTKRWLLHRRLSHLNFACALGKSKKSSHQPKAEDTNQEKLYLLHMNLCGPMCVASINGKSSEPELQYMTPATSCTGLVSKPVSQQPCIPPNRDDWDRLFQPMFDEYFNPLTIIVSLVPEAAAPRAEVLADSPVSIFINQDAPSTSIPSSQEQEHSLIISQGFEESPKTPTFHDDPLNESLQD